MYNPLLRRGVKHSTNTEEGWSKQKLHKWKRSTTMRDGDSEKQYNSIAATHVSVFGRTRVAGPPGPLPRGPPQFTTNNPFAPN